MHLHFQKIEKNIYTSVIWKKTKIFLEGFYISAGAENKQLKMLLQK
jgi:hypothetical protein